MPGGGKQYYLTSTTLVSMNLSHIIEHTILEPDCPAVQIQTLCEEALAHRFPAICIPPFHINKAVSFLEESPVKIGSVIGFPMGYNSTPAKVEEIKRAIDDGVDELDAAVNLCAVKSDNWNYVKNDIDSMMMAVHLKGKIIKIILETALLTKKELERLCGICTETGVDYVGTATGFNGGGATVEMVSFLRRQLPANIKIKACGGIQTAELAGQLAEAGANRIGLPSNLDIIGSL